MYSDGALASGTRDISYSSSKERLKKCRNFQKNSTKLESSEIRGLRGHLLDYCPFRDKTENIPKPQNLFCIFSVHRKQMMLSKRYSVHNLNSLNSIDLLSVALNHGDES